MFCSILIRINFSSADDVSLTLSLPVRIAIKSWKDKIMNQEEILNEQEKAILSMLQSHNKEEIAEILKISSHSLQSHISKFERLGLWSELRISLKLR